MCFGHESRPDSGAFFSDWTILSLALSWCGSLFIALLHSCLQAISAWLHFRVVGRIIFITVKYRMATSENSDMSHINETPSIFNSLNFSNNWRHEATVHRKPGQDSNPTRAAASGADAEHTFYLPHLIMPLTCCPGFPFLPGSPL